jgi:hypothetical protein
LARRAPLLGIWRGNLIWCPQAERRPLGRPRCSGQLDLLGSGAAQRDEPLQKMNSDLSTYRSSAATWRARPSKNIAATSPSQSNLCVNFGSSSDSWESSLIWAAIGLICVDFIVRCMRIWLSNVLEVALFCWKNVRYCVLSWIRTCLIGKFALHSTELSWLANVR